MKRCMALFCLVAICTLVGAQEAPVAAEEPVAKTAAKDDSATMPKLEKEGEGIEVPELADMEEFREWLLTLTQGERDEVFIASDAGPMPSGLYTGFMLSDRPNFEDFDISITKKAIMTFIFDRWLGKTFDGKGNLANILRDESGFEKKDLKGTLTLEKGYSDDKDSWIALYGKDTAYDFILDEFREIRPNFLFGKTYLVPPEKGDKVFFECGLVKIGDEAPAGQTPSEFLLDNLAEAEPTALGEPVSETVPVPPAETKKDEAEKNKEDDYAEKEVAEEPLVKAQDSPDPAPATLPTPEAEAPEAEPDLDLDEIMD
ncbi:hypothetical protein BSKO_01875 [Bryopsis sp. KO-2023]|nr:hypothetical protein BSKO_01875 [Bryopsis sp. KO-2023]